MPVDFLSEAERERWQRFPNAMPQDDLVVFFHLSEEDKREAQHQRDAQNRLGYALQLCMLRYLGFVPDDQRQGLAEGWRPLLERVRKQAEATRATR